MPDIIHLLPDSIANQIAAGEVIQRPASVVKELVENSIDAGATQIQIVIKNAGKTLIQVIDNGKGMSATDARMAFERHATSKIQKADDLFSLTTMGFRGEALPSIAAISQVEVKTRKEEDEIGTRLSISGSKVEEQEAISCAKGTIISVKNIFFNVPARRKFLKSNESERRNILMEIERLVLANPDIEFSLIENDIQTLQLPPGVLRKRIV
ncbi:MAG: DNA mismatch repair protein MutL, partial [Bacteroidales bacterium]|nr:DNA mismatch repair protein MutL [Bacteroidales bacterium]